MFPGMQVMGGDRNPCVHIDVVENGYIVVINKKVKMQDFIIDMSKKLMEETDDVLSKIQNEVSEENKKLSIKTVHTTLEDVLKYLSEQKEHLII
jgi:hypothetical protein